MKCIRLLYKGLVFVEGFLSKILFILITLLTFISAMSRVFGFPLPWSLELILVFFAWFSFLSASQAVRRKTLLGIDIFTRHLPHKVQHVLEIINNILILCFLAVLGYAAFILSVNFSVRQIASLQISYSVVSASLFAGCFLMFLSECIHLVNQLRYLLCGGSST